jgi:hypothetical protein
MLSVSNIEMYKHFSNKNTNRQEGQKMPRQDAVPKKLAPKN